MLRNHERDGYVSVWVAQVPSEEALETYVRRTYTEDGAGIPAPIQRDFGIARFDPDFREAERADASARTVGRLISGASYDGAILGHLGASAHADLGADYNAIVLLYNLQYDGTTAVARGPWGTYRFVGAVRYR